MGEATYEVENNDVTVECWHACREGNITPYWTVQIPPDYGNFTLLYNDSTLLDEFMNDHNLMASISTTDKCHEDRVYYYLQVNNEACLNNSRVLCGVILNDRNLHFTSSKISPIYIPPVTPSPFSKLVITVHCRLVIRKVRGIGGYSLSYG